MLRIEMPMVLVHVFQLASISIDCRHLLRLLLFTSQNNAILSTCSFRLPASFHLKTIDKMQFLRVCVHESYSRAQ